MVIVDRNQYNYLRQADIPGFARAGHADKIPTPRQKSRKLKGVMVSLNHLILKLSVSIRIH